MEGSIALVEWSNEPIGNNRVKMRKTQGEVEMAGSIYLSVNSPEQGAQARDEYMDVIEAVQSAILSFVHVFLGRKPLVWCGHPEVAAQISFMAKDLGIDEKSWIKVYKPKAILEQLQSHGMEFGDCNVITVDSMSDSSDPYYETRELMFKENDFSHAVFIGGNENTLKEYGQLKKFHPDAKIIPFTPTGGATNEIACLEESDFDENLAMEEYILVFFDHLGIAVNEERRKYHDSIEDDKFLNESIVKSDINEKIKQEYVITQPL